MATAMKDRMSSDSYCAIQEHFWPNIIAHTMKLQEELIGHRLHESKSILTYFNDVDAIAWRLCVAKGRTYGIGKVFKYVTRGLLKTYSSMVNNLFAMCGKNELTIQALQSILLEKEQRLEAENANESLEARAFLLKNKQIEKCNPHALHGKTGWKMGGKQGKGGPVCYQCSSISHFVAQCASKGNKETHKHGGGQQKGGKGTSMAVFNTCFATFCLQLSLRPSIAKQNTKEMKVCDGDTWMWDSGLTHVMTWNIQDLKNATRVNTKVMEPSGKTLEITHVSNLQMATLDTNGMADGKILIRDVLCVPGLQVKVLAHHPFGDRGFGLCGFGNHIDVINHGGKQIFSIVADNESKLYKVLAKALMKNELEDSNEKQILLAVADTADYINPILLWHEHFGHASVETIKKTVKNFEGIDARVEKANSPGTICGPCAQG
jgi:hypothetical protein